MKTINFYCSNDIMCSGEAHMKNEDIKFGVFLPTGYGPKVTYGFNLDITLAAEKSDFNSAWACDHLYGGGRLSLKGK